MSSPASAPDVSPELGVSSRRVVAFGGGTGMAALLAGLKHRCESITAVVTVTDNGGSSGLLRREYDMVAPGDIRNCLLALADIDPRLRQVLQYRFDEGEFVDHSFGNLLITVMARIVGDFSGAVRELNRLLHVRGRVIPATSTKTSLVAEHPDGSKSTGEVQITRSGKRILKVELRPSPVFLSDEIREAVEAADLFLFGPGSLYTSVIPNLLIDGLVEAVARTGKPRVYICNIMTQPGETDGYTLADHVRALRAHCGGSFPDAVIAHNGQVPEGVLRHYRLSGSSPVRCDLHEDDELAHLRLVTENFFHEPEGGERSEENASKSARFTKTARHDPGILAKVIYEQFLVEDSPEIEPHGAALRSSRDELGG